MRKFIWLVITLVTVMSWGNKVSAQDDVLKAKIKFIYNFTRYVEWPPEAINGEFVIDVYGSQEVFNELKSFTSDKYIGNRPVKVVKVSNPGEISNCQMLFVGFDKTRDLKSIFAGLRNKSTLIITEKDGALDEGSVINFILSEDKLSYEIKPYNAAMVGLKLNSTIITYAKRKA